MGDDMKCEDLQKLLEDCLVFWVLGSVGLEVWAGVGLGWV